MKYFSHIGHVLYFVTVIQDALLKKRNRHGNVYKYFLASYVLSDIRKHCVLNVLYTNIDVYSVSGSIIDMSDRNNIESQTSIAHSV